MSELTANCNARLAFKETFIKTFLTSFQAKY